VLHGTWLVIRLGQEIMLTNNVTKFDDDPLKNIKVIKRTNALDAAGRMSFHNRSGFSNGRIKKMQLDQTQITCISININ